MICFRNQIFVLATDVTKAYHELSTGKVLHLSHFKATLQVDFRYAALFYMEDNLNVFFSMEHDLKQFLNGRRPQTNSYERRPHFFC